MAKATFHFRTFATDESDNWTLPDQLRGCSVFGLYFFLEGEATHICSLTPSSRVEFLENVFLGADDEESARDYLDGPGDDLRNESGGEWTSYFGFIDPSAPSRSPYMGPRESFTLDSRDYDIFPAAYREAYQDRLRWNSPQKAAALASYDCLRDFAYDLAREEFGANSPGEPDVLTAAGLAAHRTRKALREAETRERREGPPGLFAWANIAAPLALSPGA